MWLHPWAVILALQRPLSCVHRSNLSRQRAEDGREALASSYHLPLGLGLCELQDQCKGRSCPAVGLTVDMLKSR